MEIIKVMNTHEKNKEMFIEWLDGATQKSLSEKYSECSATINKRLSRAMRAYNMKIYAIERKEKESKEIQTYEETYGDDAKYFLEYLMLTNDISLSMRTINLLRRNEVNDLRTIGNYTKQEFIRAFHSNMYKRSFEEIVNDVMIPLGIKFKEEK